MMKSITLPIGKTVDPFYSEKNVLIGIKVAANMSTSLFENNVVDKKSIFKLEELVLVTKYKKCTKIPLENVRLAADGSYRFYVKEGVTINRGDLVLPRYRR